MTTESDLRIATLRLTLVAATAETAAAELAGAEHLARLLRCDVPADWPPPLNDADSMAFFLRYLEEHPDGVGWAMWYFMTRQPGAKSVLVGNGGFKGKPSADGTVEVGYSIVPEFQRRGFATEAVEALVHWAFARSEVTRVIAHTFLDLLPSIGVLRKTGFADAGTGDEPGTIRFERVRPA